MVSRDVCKREVLYTVDRPVCIDVHLYNTKSAIIRIRINILLLLFQVWALVSQEQ